MSTEIQNKVLEALKGAENGATVDALSKELKATADALRITLNDLMDDDLVVRNIDTKTKTITYSINPAPAQLAQPKGKTEAPATEETTEAPTEAPVEQPATTTTTEAKEPTKAEKAKAEKQAKAEAAKKAKEEKAAAAKKAKEEKAAKAATKGEKIAPDAKYITKTGQISYAKLCDKKRGDVVKFTTRGSDKTEVTGVVLFADWDFWQQKVYLRVADAAKERWVSPDKVEVVKATAAQQKVFDAKLEARKEPKQAQWKTDLCLAKKG